MLAACNGADAYGDVNPRELPPAVRHIRQANFIADFLRRFSVLLVVYEDYAYNSVHRGYDLAEFGGVLKSALHRRCKKPPLLVAPARVKRFAVGRGDADKTMMAERAFAECPQLRKAAGRRLDVCDAFFLARYGWYMTHPEKAFMADRGVPNLRQRLEMTQEERHD